MSGKAVLDTLGPALVEAKRIRYMRPEAFGDVTLEDLDTAARTLRAIAYSCDQGAKVLDHARRARLEPDEPTT